MEVITVHPPPQTSSNAPIPQIVVREFYSDKLGLSNEFCSNPIYRGICELNPRSTLHNIKKAKSDINVTCSKTGNSLLHVVLVEANPITEIKYVPFVYQLSNANVDFDIANNKGERPIQLAIKNNLLDLMVALIKCGATCHPEEDLELIATVSGPVEYEFRAAYRKFSPGYWLPVEEDKAFKVNVLVKSWCRINIQKQGKTLIEFAKESGAQDKIVKMLIDNENSIEFAHATIAGDEQRMTTLLMHYSVDMETKDYSHKENFFEVYSPLTLYGAAIKYGHKHILPILKNTGKYVFRNRNNSSETAEDSSGSSYSSTVCAIL